MDTLRGGYADRVVKKARTYPAGRVCDEDECEVVLSRYNRTPWCSVHERVLIVPFTAPRPGRPGARLSVV